MVFSDHNADHVGYHLFSILRIPFVLFASHLCSGAAQLRSHRHQQSRQKYLARPSIPSGNARARGCLWMFVCCVVNMWGVCSCLIGTAGCGEDAEKRARRGEDSECCWTKEVVPFSTEAQHATANGAPNDWHRETFPVLFAALSAGRVKRHRCIWKKEG